jgi:hypothetical protein
VPYIRSAFMTIFALGALGAADYSWQTVPAKVLPTGDLEWQPEAFVFEAGSAPRYIDFEAGDDNKDGSSPAQAWKHHPWDVAATAKSAACSGIHTYVFKRGVIYRGNLVIDDQGSAEEPIRLTSDPAWGTGEAIIAGSERVSGWVQGRARPEMPDGQKVWSADLPFAPRSVWALDANGEATRIPLARTPNWTVSNPEDVMSEWWELDQPEWWKDQNKATVGKKKMHLAIDKTHITESADYYDGALMWPEWGIVMGTPFPTRVEAVDLDKHGLAVQGPWWGDSGKLLTGNRYFLEDKPHYLDSPGEFWFEKKGEGGRLFLRLPGDADPNSVAIEAAKRYSLIEDQASAKAPLRLDIIGPEGRAAVDTTGTAHLEISGLSFRYTQQWWELEQPAWMHKEVDPAAIRLRGENNDINIHHCRFVDVVAGVRILPINDKPRDAGIRISDNDFLRTDDGAIDVGKGNGTMADAHILRNRLHLIGMRPNRQSSAPALTVLFPTTMEVAGNMLSRCYGPGIFVFGGKGSGAGGEVPFFRGLIHHNKAEQCLLAANDWGAIEAWQGGPFYIYDNIAANPNGLWNWAAGKDFNARLGYAYYLDGGFKNYLFNNIAWGLNNEKDSRLCNGAAFQEAVPTIYNSFFNNTAYRFAKGSNWSPRGGHHKYLGNIFDDISKNVFDLGQLKEDKSPSPTEYPHGLMAFSNNVFHAIGSYGWFQNLVPEAEKEHKDFASMLAAVKKQNTMNPTLGQEVAESPLRDPANRDMRPKPGSPAIDAGVTVFVPWSLSAVVGEWNFIPRGDDPRSIPDEHWFMTNYYRNRETYHELPQYPLTVVGPADGAFVTGTLEDWIEGALDCSNGRYATVSQDVLMQPVEFEVRKGNERVTERAEGAALRTPDINDTSLLIEVVLRCSSAKGEGVVIEKLSGSGYRLLRQADGTVLFALADSAAGKASVTSTGSIADGAWHHIVAEFDRNAGTLSIYLDGKRDAQVKVAALGSLANDAAVTVGGAADGRSLDGAIDFMRICQGSLADAQTSIEELHAWEFAGPQLRDFCGTPIQGSRRDAGALEFLAP